MKDVQLLIDGIVHKWIGKETNLDYYTRDEFESIIEKKLKEQVSLLEKAGGLSTIIGSMHSYTIIHILEPLLAKIKYGKRV